MRKSCAGIVLLMVWMSCIGFQSRAQEGVAPMMHRYFPQGKKADGLKKTTALIIPFFEDFTNYSLYPDASRWVDAQEVYVNNTMCVSPVSRGVATFDALNANGRPYDTVNSNDLIYADSLTTLPFDFSAYQPSDSIYLSFFYQPQGNGFSPEPQDSLMLYFHPKQGGWQLVWAVPGTTLQPFQQVMIPVTDTNFLFDSFQFRFVNKASINTNDDVWNVDYIRMYANRTFNDTAVRDLAFTTDPTFLLNDYTFMTYRQFLANPGAVRATQMSDTIANHYSTNSTVQYGYTARETTTSTALGAAASTINIPLYSQRGVSFPVYTNTIAQPAPGAKVVFENKFYLQSGNPAEPKDNDTIVREQIFDNYLAYDDGTAEKSYFLNLFPNLPGKIAVEYNLSLPDTLRGVAIYFGQQVPTAYNKMFSLAVYSKLQGVNNAPYDTVLRQQDNFYPLFTDTINNFTIYRFDTPVILPAGVFYIGTIQPANSYSDSLYIGLDANRIGGNHVYFNTLDLWHGSILSGAVMIRPLLGHAIIGTAVNDIRMQPQTDWQLYPNPARSVINISSVKNYSAYRITDITGREICESRTASGAGIDISSLLPGAYLLQIANNGLWSQAKKFIKI